MPDSKHIHLIAVAGVGMSALAGLLKAAGYRVSGSDAHIFPPMSLLLEQAGVPVKLGFDAANIASDVDRVVIGNAVRADHPEVVATMQRGIPYLSMPEALSSFFLQNRRPSVVAGTHGKTTTASLLAWVLTHAGLDPGMMIGGWVKNFGTNHRLGKPPHFVVEGDEYDTAFFDKEAKFFHYRPHQAILTSVEYDHGDIYPDLAAIQAAFSKFVGLIPRDGALVAADDPVVRDVAKGAMCPVVFYGFGPSADWRAEALQTHGDRLTFSVAFRGRRMGVIESPLAGRHNVMNTLAVIALTHHIGLPWTDIAAGIACFEGIKRRQEVVGVVRDIRVIDDFAHHPTAIAETLDALRLRYQPRTLVAVFEPRSASSRRNIFQNAFVSAFAHADFTLLADVFAADKLADDVRLDPKRIVSDLIAAGHRAAFVPTVDEIVTVLARSLQPGDVVCIMSSGGFDSIHTKLLAALHRQEIT